jgi:hypothetical protein
MGVYVSASCGVALATVPEPLATRPDVVETDHEVPAGIAVPVVTVTTVGTPTAARSGKKLTVVGRDTGTSTKKTCAPAYSSGASIPAIFTKSRLGPGAVGVTVNVTTPVAGTYASDVQFATGGSALVVPRCTVMFSTRRLDAPEPPKVSVCCSAGVPTVNPGEIAAPATLTLFGIGALAVLVVPPSVSCTVPVEALAVGVYVSASCGVALATVPEPLTVPDVVETDHEDPAGIGVTVVAVTTVGTPTAAKAGKKLTVVGKEKSTRMTCAYSNGASTPAIFTYSLLGPGAVGVIVKVSTPVPGAYASEEQFETGGSALVVLR